jgi:hypothetical protein
MSRSGVRVVDMTARLGGLAIGQTGATLSTTESRQAIALSTTPGMPTIDWVRPPYPNDDLAADDGPAALLVIVGPGSVHGVLDLLRRAWAAKVPAVRLLLMPSAIVEEMTFVPMVTADTPSTLLYRLPDSSPETLWFVLIEEFNKLSSLYGLTSLQPTQSLNKDIMSNLKQSMDATMTIDGALAAALVDFRSGMCLAQAGTGMNLDLAAAGNTQVVRAKLQTMESLGLRKGIEDILITLTDQYHLIRLVPNNAGLFLYLVLDKNKGNLALARYKLTEIERALQV